MNEFKITNDAVTADGIKPGKLKRWGKKSSNKKDIVTIVNVVGQNENS